VNASNTRKQQAVGEALAKHPRAPGEMKTVWYKRVAAVAGVSFDYVRYNVEFARCAAIGVAHRAKEAEDAKFRVEVVPAVGLGPVQNFRGWLDVFGKLKILSEAYLNLARSKGDVYAAAFLQDIIDISERALARAGRSIAS
jgi:hypothetical protein